MNKQPHTYTAVQTESRTFSKWDDYAMLVKLRLNLFVVFSAVIAYLIVAQQINWVHVAFLALGGFLITASSNALNQVLEKDFDKQMNRTQDRPLAAERMKPSEAVIFAGVSAILGFVLLAMINPLVVLLSTLSLVSYSFVYTPLKRVSTLAVAVGAIPGALPVMIGGVAAEGQLTFLIASLFFIQFLWQFPHFWAIAYLAFDDYQRAGFKLLPTDENGNIDKNLGLHASIYALLIVPFVVLLYASGEASIIASAIALIASVYYLIMSIKFFRDANRKSALALMFSSFIFLPAVLFAYWLF